MRACLPTFDAREEEFAARERQGVACMALGGLILGTMGVFLEESGQPSVTALWFRCTFGLATLSLWAALVGNWRTLRVPRSAWCVVLTVCALMPLNWWLFFEALKRTSISVATVVFHVQPLLVLWLAALVERERVAFRLVVLSLLALFGLALATGWLSRSASGFGNPDAGYTISIALCLSAALTYAIVTLLARSSKVGSMTLAWWQCLAGTLVLGPWMVVNSAWPSWGPAWGWLAGLGVIHTGLAYVVLYAGMARLPASRIALLQFLYPLTAVVADAAVYGRTLDAFQWLGTLLLAAAILEAGRNIAPAASPSETLPVAQR